ncbi:uncharacterized protein LOC106138168 [Amyelois transitella]|uniref:uncharacterized protein LOC106138168 n=1 Tax=Amyelois transitella TaxID=680683 RepID=UPI00298FECE2|nr:uncharacterized protein LOC106138168 [Amyelois transitella]
MGIVYVMELVLIVIIVVLCSILMFKLLYKLRSTLPWRVNCWFCNGDFWVKFLIRNNWICPRCEQYNGFTKDGDYNKPIIPNNEQALPPRVFQKSPPRNGLCKMCNINQQLKVAQLASFVPMHEKKYDEEIEVYRAQLEKAYKLCSPCKRVLQMKLHKEKETLLATKLLEKRSSEKSGQHKEIQNKILKSFINKTSTLIATVLILLITIELYKNIENHKKLPKSVTNVKQIVTGLFERIVSIVKMKMLMTFPVLENYLVDVNVLFDKLPKMNLTSEDISSFMLLTQKALGGFVCFIQIIGHVWNVNKQKYTIAIDLLWSVFVISAMSHGVTIDPVIISVIKLASASIVLLIYMSMKNKPLKTSRIYATPKRMKNLVNGSKTSIDEDDTFSFDTDDDVSLSKFGLRNFSDSSNDTISPLSNSLNGRTFTPRSDSVWTKPKHNSTFCVNSLVSKSPSSVSETVFAKPSFNKYQKFDKDDSDSDLDESISSLCISSQKKARKINPIFSLRKYNPTPTFVTPTAMNRARPLISPSKLGHSTSWVAGGYWGSDGERQLFNLDGSRSSSQSSGFESQTSSVNQRNIFSQPPSREESVCGEPMAVDNQVPSFNNFQSPQNFSRVSSPVFPQMQYNSHVHIPQARFAHQAAAHAVFSQQQYLQNNMFKTPGGSGLIKLPQVNSFASN